MAALRLGRWFRLLTGGGRPGILGDGSMFPAPRRRPEDDWGLVARDLAAAMALMECPPGRDSNPHAPDIPASGDGTTANTWSPGGEPIVEGGNVEYIVRWEIDASADSPDAAARKALDIQRNPNSIAMFFQVSSDGGASWLDVDLYEGE